jgi:hypothetical protein
MLRTLKIVFGWTLVLATFMLLHYALPQHDIVRITSTEVIRQDFTALNRRFYAQADSGSAELATRDLRLINTEKRKTFLLGFIAREAREVMVYRNEDTGWIWPPYFKFDSSDLQAEASAKIAAAGDESWAVMTHYGWRNRLLTIYPNAIAVRPIDGPDVRVIPWFNIFFFIFTAIGMLFIRAMWRQFRQRAVDPVLEDVEEASDAARARARGVTGSLRQWLSSWRRKS